MVENKPTVTSPKLTKKNYHVRQKISSHDVGNYTITVLWWYRYHYHHPEG
jgi:hypothetical protein